MQKKKFEVSQPCLVPHWRYAHVEAQSEEEAIKLASAPGFEWDTWDPVPGCAHNVQGDGDIEAEDLGEDEDEE